MNETKRPRPREFWKLFKKKQTNIVGEEISIESFQNHFKNLSSQNEDQLHQELEKLTTSCDLINKRVTFEELDSHISQTEIRRACKQLNTNKAPSMENILYEYLTESIDLTVSSFEILFNYILETGDFPKNWSKGPIIPVFKKVTSLILPIIGV